MKKDFGKLIRSITSNVNFYISNQVEKYGIKSGQMDYFLIIWYTPGINQLELARLKNVGKASVTKALKILEVDGFIRRVVDENDRRKILCYITEKGEKIADDLLNVKNEAEQQLFKEFSDSDLEVFSGYLEKLNRNAEFLANSNCIQKSH